MINGQCQAAEAKEESREVVSGVQPTSGHVRRGRCSQSLEGVGALGNRRELRGQEEGKDDSGAK